MRHTIVNSLLWIPQGTSPDSQIWAEQSSEVASDLDVQAESRGIKRVVHSRMLVPRDQKIS